MSECRNKFVAVASIHCAGAAVVAEVLKQLGVDIERPTPESKLLKICMDFVGPQPNYARHEQRDLAKSVLKDYLMTRIDPGAGSASVVGEQQVLFCRMYGMLREILPSSQFYVVNVDRPIEEATEAFIQQQPTRTGTEIKEYQEWLQTGKNLWLAEMPDDRKITTSTQALRKDTDNELKKLATFLGLTPTDEQYAAATKFLSDRFERKPPQPKPAPPVTPPPPQDKYLFVLCSNNSGSTVLQMLLSSSPNAVPMSGEGQYLLPPEHAFIRPEEGLWTEYKEQLVDDKLNKWAEIKQDFLNEWKTQLEKKPTKTPVFIEKSPLHIARWPKFKEIFPGCYGIAMIRDPYAVCEGIRRRRGYQGSMIADAAVHWMQAAEILRAICEREPKSNFKWITYEKLCGEPEAVAKDILAWMPELTDMQPDMKFDIVRRDGNRPIPTPGLPNNSKLVNCNDAQISRLSKEDIKLISHVLSLDTETLDFFGYKLM